MLHQIGVGALGPVFRTYEPERDRLVAVKVFRLDITPEQAQALAAELARAADAGLFHPSIVEPLGAGVEGTLAYAADEYVAAESLDVALRHYAPASVDTALPFITQLAGAIDFARAAGVGHGALHPRDIFVTPEEARATGFGVVEALERIGLRAPVRRPYTAPERIAGLPWSTPADVFSLAAIAYELLTGRRPAGLGAELGALSAGTPNESAQAIHAVLARAMDEDPSRRYESALQLASALEAAARGDLQAIGALPGTTPVVSTPQAGSHASGDRPAELTALPALASDHVDAPRDAAAERLEADEPAREQELLRVTDASPPEPEGERDLAFRYAEEPVEAIPAFDLRNDEPEDIAAERGDDDVHHRLMLDDWRDAEDWRDAHSRDTPATEDAAGEPAGRHQVAEAEIEDDIAAESESDRFLLEAASAAASEPGTDDFGVIGDAPPRAVSPDVEEEIRADAPVGVSESGAAAPPPARFFDDDLLRDAAPEAGPPPSAGIADDGWRADEHPVGPARPGLFGSSDDTGDDAAATDRFVDEAELVPSGHDESPRSRVAFPALLLAVGLLAGIGVGYALWGGRPPVTGPAAAPAEEPATQAAREPAAPASDAPARDVTETPATPPSDTGTAATPAASPAPPAASPTAAREAAVPPATRKPAGPSRGTLVVRSTPSGAGVTVNGTWRGRTPLRLADLPFARYDIRIVEPGYRLVSESLALSADTPERTMTARLQREPAARGAQGGTRGSPATRGGQPAAAAPAARGAQPGAEAFTGSIYVDSRPRGATVAINGKPVGVTPLRIPDIRIGTHVVRLELPDHRIWSATARVTAGQEARVTGSLEPIQ